MVSPKNLKRKSAHWLFTEHSSTFKKETYYAHTSGELTNPKTVGCSSFVGCLRQKTEDLASHSYFGLLPVQEGPPLFLIISNGPQALSLC